MAAPLDARYTAFEGNREIAHGTLAEVALAVKFAVERGSADLVLAFDDESGKRVDIDVSGTDDDVLERLEATLRGSTIAENDRDREATSTSNSPRGRGRPKLGVVAREVTLLPRHWEWLNGQPGGASVALRKLVDQARRTNEDADRLRRAREAAYHVMSAMAGDLPGFEEATRALFSGQSDRFTAFVDAWPYDVARYVARLAGPGFAAAE